MSNLSHKLHSKLLRRQRVRAVISGSNERPRLSVHVSNKHVIAQILDDSNHQTIAYVSTVGSKDAKGSMTEKAVWVGAEIAKKAKAAKIKQVVFDRGSKLYHGRTKALADQARNGGLEF